MNKKWSVLFELSILILISINIIYAISGAIHFPLAHIDVWSDWLYKAKALYLFHYSLDFLIYSHNQFNHPQYPLLMPLFYATIYQLLGGVNEMAVSLFSPIVYGAILFLCYRFLRKLGQTKNFALFFTYIYSMLSPLIAQGGRMHAGMPDIFITLCHWWAVYVLWNIYKNPKTAAKQSWWLVLCVIIASMIKTEGAFIALYLLFLPLVRNQKIVRLVLASTAAVGWDMVVKVLHIPKTYGLSLVNLPTLPYRFLVMTTETLHELFLNINNWYFFWWIFFLLLITTQPKHPFIKKNIVPLLMLCAAAFVGIYLFATVPITGYVSSSLDRLLLQISPLWILVFAEAAQRFLSDILKRLPRNYATIV